MAKLVQTTSISMRYYALIMFNMHFWFVNDVDQPTTYGLMVYATFIDEPLVNGGF